MKGKVKFFNRQKKFGFIGGEDNKEYFVHESGVEKGPIDENDDVTFEVEDGDRGPKAVKVKKSE
ncbi:cold shock domain-containing protein [Candidatus Pacearchaeota archaeon]|nr:cold shock domain-containing protein [Candidatus Pacearchaeota archaeon]